MRVISVLKVALLAVAVTLPASLPAAAGKALPPGACAYEKKGVVANTTFCSYQCNAQTMWCAQQLCTNGVLTQVLPCYGSFCSPKCGG
jgi:hypothetical protein